MKLPAALLLLSTAVAATAADEPAKPLGYQDTPLIPGTNWHVHDGTRPQPRIVTPGAPATADKPAGAPSDAVVLFSGENLEQFQSSKGGEAKWKVENGYMEVVKGAGDIRTKEQFGPDLQFHIEWQTAGSATGTGQGRSNSGIFFFGQYEIQVLDSYKNPTYPDGQAGSLYGQMPPLVNASRPAGEWQTYDILFTGPRFNEDGAVAKAAFATVLHNGVVVQNHTELLGASGHKTVGKYKKHEEKGFIRFQDHGDPVRFRNMWIRELKPVDSQ